MSVPRRSGRFRPFTGFPVRPAPGLQATTAEIAVTDLTCLGARSVRGTAGIPVIDITGLLATTSLAGFPGIASIDFTGLNPRSVRATAGLPVADFTSLGARQFTTTAGIPSTDLTSLGARSVRATAGIPRADLTSINSVGSLPGGPASGTAEIAVADFTGIGARSVRGTAGISLTDLTALTSSGGLTKGTAGLPVVVFDAINGHHHFGVPLAYPDYLPAQADADFENRVYLQEFEQSGIYGGGTTGVPRLDLTSLSIDRGVQGTANISSQDFDALAARSFISGIPLADFTANTASPFSSKLAFIDFTALNARPFGVGIATTDFAAIDAQIIKGVETGLPRHDFIALNATPKARTGIPLAVFNALEAREFAQLLFLDNEVFIIQTVDKDASINQTVDKDVLI